MNARFLFFFQGFHSDLFHPFLSLLQRPGSAGLGVGLSLRAFPARAPGAHTDVLLRTRRHQRGEERSRGFPLLAAPLSPLEGSSDGIKVRHHWGRPRNVSPALCRL